MSINIYIKQFLLLSLAFILFIPIVTISHEFGHIIIAKGLGYKTDMNYRSMRYNYEETKNTLLKTYNQSDIHLKENLEFNEKIEKLKIDDLLIAIGGPISTVFLGTIGFTFLILRRKQNKTIDLKIMDLFLIFLSLFWLRQILTLAFPIIHEIINPVGKWFSGDEFLICKKLGIWSGTLSILLGLIGVFITTYVTFKVVPKKNRFTFILSGFIGCLSGFIIWMYFIGPKLLPYNNLLI